MGLLEHFPRTHVISYNAGFSGIRRTMLPPPDAEDPVAQDAAELTAQPERPAAPPAAPEPHDPYVALRNANYRRYFIGNAFSLIGSNMTTYTVGYELYQRTGSTLMLGMVGLMQVIPILLLALPAGHFVDRFNRKTMILVATAAQIVLWVVMGLSSRYAAEMFPGLGQWFGYGDAHAPIMLALLLLNGVGRAVNQPAKQTLLPMLVPARHFPNAITWNASLFETSNVVGPMLGGFAVAAMQGIHPTPVTATWTFALIYFANSAFGTVYWINIARIRLDAQPPARGGRPDSMIASIAEGVRFVYGNKLILSAITLDMFAVLLGGATALLPAFAEQVVRVGPVGLACLRAAPSIGSVLMAMIVAHMPPMKHAGRNLLFAVTGFGLMIIVFGTSRIFTVSLAALFFAGMCDNISVVVRHSLVQLLTPDPMRGRVNSVNTVFISSSNELGEFESGTTAHIAQRLVARYGAQGMALVWGPMIAATAGGVGTIVVVIVAAMLWPELRRVGRLDELRAMADTQHQNTKR
jgi:MFS family permease